MTNDSLLKTLFRADELEMLVCGSQVIYHLNCLIYFNSS